MTSLQQWSIVWQFNISERKGVYLHDGRDRLPEHNGINPLGSKTSVASNVKDLRITKFTAHIIASVSKAHARAWWIHRCFISKISSIINESLNNLHATFSRICRLYLVSNIYFVWQRIKNRRRNRLPNGFSGTFTPRSAFLSLVYKASSWDGFV